MCESRESRPTPSRPPAGGGPGRPGWLAGRLGAMYLVIGGGGFHGAAIAELLLSRGDAVTLFDTKRPRSRAVSEGRLRFIQGSILSRGDLEAACRGGAGRGREGGAITTVFHAASVSRWNPRLGLAQVYRLHVVGTDNVIAACLATGVACLVYTSSADVTALDPRQPRGGIGEGLPCLSCHTDVHVRSRALAEAAVLSANFRPYTDPELHRGRLRTVAIRPQLCFGPRGWLLPGIVRLAQHKCGQSRPALSGVVGDGENVVDLVYIENSAYAHVLAAESMRAPSSRVPGRHYLIGNGEPVPIWAAIHTLFGMLDLQPLVRRPRQARYTAPRLSNPAVATMISSPQ
jgi:nucleoside-diphosphate-sugar epimerase